MSNPVLWWQMLLVAFGLTALYVAGGWWLLRRTTRLHQRSEIDTAHLELLQSQISALQRDVQRLAEQLLAAGRALSAATEIIKHKAMTAGGEEAEITPYNRAIELARQGVPVGEVANQCGISRSEAELIVALYRRA